MLLRGQAVTAASSPTLVLVRAREDKWEMFVCVLLRVNLIRGGSYSVLKADMSLHTQTRTEKNVMGSNSISLKVFLNLLEVSKS